MKRNQLVVVALLLVAAAVALSIFLRDPEPASIDAASQAYPMQGDQPAASWRAGAGRPERPDAGRAALDPLDCATPFGDVARVDGEAITARELCAVWRHVAGAAELGDPTVLQQQGKTLLDAIIDARLVHRALASTGREVAESDVDAALEAMIVQQRASSRAAFEQGLRAQGRSVEEVRAELRRRLERRRLSEQNAGIELERLLAGLRSKAKIEYLRQ